MVTFPAFPILVNLPLGALKNPTAPSHTTCLRKATAKLKGFGNSTRSPAPARPHPEATTQGGADGDHRADHEAW